MVLDFDLFKNDKRYWRKYFTKDIPVTMWLEFLRNPFSKEVIETEERTPELKESKEILERLNKSPKDKER